MVVTLTVSFDDVAPRAALARADAGARDLTPLMDQIGTVLVNGAVERIGQTNVAPDGTPWPKSLRAQLEDGVTLHDSGQLMRSITEEAAPNQVTVGSNMIYAGIHQTGGTIVPREKGALTFTLANGETVTVGSVTIPARPYLGISEGEQADIEDLSVAYFTGLLDGGAP
ncbi:phage virion morphogenesis protein [Salipiger abyssi]|uniref:Phage virion morphogenesis protein n=1 Tax=Salipiger abyssi TaxID=1250539 RepID=A0A1P8UXK0_9RHOB|nr:phage virion morphogenesis protein [Salipiger abyssi]ALF02104.1 virion morphogenesis protein [Pelagibaca phage vB_PeaS-P1]APZ54119.1 phage virion morphogenesis protein [Salipiger abyssi]